MSATDVSICNLALARLGTNAKIQSLSEASAEANDCSTLYDHCRRKMLIACDWRFARRHRALAPVTDEGPPPVWFYMYGYPSDCLAPRFLHAGDDLMNRQPFDVLVRQNLSTKAIVADAEGAYLVYTANIQSAATFTDAFVECLVAQLAADLAMPRTLDERKAQAMQELATQALMRYAPVDIAGHAAKRRPDAPWIKARGSGYV